MKYRRHWTPGGWLWVAFVMLIEGLIVMAFVVAFSYLATAVNLRRLWREERNEKGGIS